MLNENEKVFSFLPLSLPPPPLQIPLDLLLVPLQRILTFHLSPKNIIAENKVCPFSRGLRQKKNSFPPPSSPHNG